MSYLSISNLDFNLGFSVSLNAEKEECIGICGASGSGKSRFLRALADLDVNTGQVLLEGLKRESVCAHEWRKRVMYFPAESQWWGVVSDHFPSSQPDFSVIGLTQEITDTDCMILSSGEKQRLSVLRGLQTGPDVLLLDEPTANLDSDNRVLAEQLIEEYRNRTGAIVIWVSHDHAQLHRVSSAVYEMTNAGLILKEPENG